MFCQGYFLVILLQLTVVDGFSCSAKNCRDCVSSSFLQCRWCRRNNKCHMPGAIATNPCKSAENIFDESHCNDELSHYDPDLSLKMLLLSAAAYDPVHPQECLDNSLPSSKFQLRTVATANCDVFHECSGYVAVSHVDKAIAVTFRGSNSFNQMFVQVVEVLASPKTAFFEGKVQTYWKRGFETLWQYMEAEVKVLVSENPTYQIWVTGHSLGGAMASLASTWLGYYSFAPRKNLILYTFGMPRVGNYDYALQHDQLVNNSWRVVNYDDLVPHFPSLASLSVINGPYHHGVEAFYSEPASSVYSEHRECHGKPYNEDITCSLSEITGSIETHRTYFSIPVGTFFETKCVHSRRKKRQALKKSNETPPKKISV